MRSKKQCYYWSLFVSCLGYCSLVLVLLELELVLASESWHKACLELEG